MKKLALGLSLLVTCQLVAGCGNQKVQGKIEGHVSEKNNAEEKGGTYETKSGTPALDSQGIEMKGNIKVSTYEDDDYVAAAAKAFEEKYPGVKVDVEVFAPLKIENSADGETTIVSENQDPNLSIDKYMTQLNAAFMNETASDLINLQGLPFYKYASRGCLYDLKNTVNGKDGLTSDAYYTNVIEAMAYGDGYYNMPFFFSTDVVGVIKDRMEQAGITSKDLTNETWTLSSMSDLLKKINEKTGKKYVIEKAAPEYVLTKYARVGSNQFIDLANKTVHFDSEAFISLLKQIIALKEEGYIEDNNSDNELFKHNYQVGGPYCNDTYYTTDYDDGHVAWKPFTDEEGNMQVESYCSYGLNAHSKQKELCWAFMKFLYSDEMQTDPAVFGRCMNKAADEKTIKDHIAYEMQDSSIHFSEGEEEVTKDYLERYTNWANRVKSCDINLVEKSIYVTMRDEVKPYFEGKKSAEEVAKILQNKVNVMLNE